MVRTALAASVAKGSNSNVGRTVTMAAWDSVNGNSFQSTGNDLLVARNGHATLARTVTVTSVADPFFGRTGDITAFSLAVGAVAVFGPFKSDGWRQADGFIYVDASTIDITFGVVTLS